jgi:hypothetical protein
MIPEGIEGAVKIVELKRKHDAPLMGLEPRKRRSPELHPSGKDRPARILEALRPKPRNQKPSNHKSQQQGSVESSSLPDYDDLPDYELQGVEPILLTTSRALNHP